MQGFENFDISSWFDGVTFARIPESREARQVAKRMASTARNIVGSVSVMAGMTLAGHAMANQSDASVPAASFSVSSSGSTMGSIGGWTADRDVGPEYMPSLIRSMADWSRVPEPSTEIQLPTLF